MHQVGMRRYFPILDKKDIARSMELIAHIKSECTALGGWLSFDQFMEKALYTPRLGYYTNSDVNTKFGISARDGSDFITAPELTPFFSYALANVISSALALSGTNEILEFGAGSGLLAADLLTALDHISPGCCRCYKIIELSEELRKQQRKTIARTSPNMLRRVLWLDALPYSFDGIVLANEVIDSMPVRLFVRRNKNWYERGVEADICGELVWVDKHISSHKLPVQLHQVPGQHDYLTETHEYAAEFVRKICKLLNKGVAILFDYGFPAKEYYHEQRISGTLMCHYRHHSYNAPLLIPGLQDITAHIDFTFIAESIIEQGSLLYGYTSQAKFLLESGILEILSKLYSPHSKQYLLATNAIQRLLSEAEMGELFKVIAFGNGLPNGLPVFDRIDRSHTLKDYM